MRCNISNPTGLNFKPSPVLIVGFEILHNLHVQAGTDHRDNSELKMHQIYDADVKKNYNYSHGFTTRIKIMASSW